MATQPQPVPALSFPRPIFAALSPHPFLAAHLASDKAIRANGRKPQEFRTPGINTGSLTHCNGSAVVRLGNTAVVCGIRAEILRAEDIANPIVTGVRREDEDGEEDDREEIEGLRLLVPNIELATGSAPSHLPGSPPSTTAQTLVTRIRSLLISAHLLRADDLRITYAPPVPEDLDTPDVEQEEEIKGYWVLYIDTMFLSLDGAAFDAAWCALLAALRDTLIPHAYYDSDLETILCSDDPSQARKLKLRGLPVPSTFAVFESTEGDKEGDSEREKAWVLSDPDAFEEGVCKETVTVVVDGSGGTKGQSEENVRKIEKSGGGVIGRENMKGLIKRGVERWGVWERVLNDK
ncbi:ribosomal protein S5 domain 2-like protein [Zopfia rhizophila CBS 207.26]|uniref:Ribosomal RNA-processing protein 43 n=1 Tax=Zopfia rhizophila CBS 207.26 TaxID=1314779 RepID=A0A6A6DHT0_9PEZI|nr:ribosomal protein S5 domain 2-like protein [Zopfia rhizophila CBS 207.26]